MAQKQDPGAEGRSPRVQHCRPQSLPCHVGHHDTRVLDPSSRVSFLAEETQLPVAQRGHPGGVWAARPAAAPRLGYEEQRRRAPGPEAHRAWVSVAARLAGEERARPPCGPGLTGYKTGRPRRAAQGLPELPAPAHLPR